MKNIYFMAILAIALFSCKKGTNAENAGNLKSEKIKGKSDGPSAAATIQFSGLTWQVREGKGDPGDNNWSANNVWVDGAGRLHLRIRRDPATGTWSCAEVISLQSFGYGSYVWNIEGAVDKLDPKIVFGMFNYKPGYNKLHEMDIEIARWGKYEWDNLNYTVWPAYGNPDNRASKTDEMKLQGTYTTYKFVRNSQQVFFKSFYGHTEAESNAFFLWNTPEFGFPVSTDALPVHMNLWLYEGKAPFNGQEVEIIVHSFRFIPG